MGPGWESLCEARCSNLNPRQSKNYSTNRFVQGSPSSLTLIRTSVTMPAYSFSHSCRSSGPVAAGFDEPHRGSLIAGRRPGGSRPEYSSISGPLPLEGGRGLGSVGRKRSPWTSCDKPLVEEYAGCFTLKLEYEDDFGVCQKSDRCLARKRRARMSIIQMSLHLLAEDIHGNGSEGEIVSQEPTAFTSTTGLHENQT
jgi:hypothetical protein